MIFFYLLFALAIVYAWGEYFRQIDIFQNNNLYHLIITFIAGALSILWVIGVDNLLSNWNIEFGSRNLYRLYYYVVEVALVEETAKLLPFVLGYYWFKKYFIEPIDYVVFICVSALGFATVENVIFMYNQGISVIIGRSILTTVSHMFDSGLVAYGIVYSIYKFKSIQLKIVLPFFLAAVISHSIFVFIPSYFTSGVMQIVLLLFYFLITVSWFATIVNNAQNISPHFTYRKYVNTILISQRILGAYAFIYLLQLSYLIYNRSLEYGIATLVVNLSMLGFVTVVTVVRMSKFTLIKGRWEKLKLELPFSYETGLSQYQGKESVSLKIKGESNIENILNQYYHEDGFLLPLSPRVSAIRHKRKIYLKDKIFVQDDVSYFLVEMFLDNDISKYFLIRPKAKGSIMRGGFHVVGLYYVDGLIAHLKTPEKKIASKKVKFVEWMIFKPQQEI